MDDLISKIQGYFSVVCAPDFSTLGTLPCPESRDQKTGTFYFLATPGPFRRTRDHSGPFDSTTSPEGVVRLFFTARIERAQPHRARSASKKNGLPAPSPHSGNAGRTKKSGSAGLSSDRQAPKQRPLSFAPRCGEEIRSEPGREEPRKLSPDRGMGHATRHAPCLQLLRIHR